MFAYECYFYGGTPTSKLSHQTVDISSEESHNWEKMRMALDYLYKLNERFRLDICTCTVPYSEEQFKKRNGAIVLAHYTRTWRKSEFYDGVNRFGTITFNVESVSKMNNEDIMELVRHELAHAICDQRYKVDNEAPCGHGKTWKRVAKLLRVDISRYKNIN